MGEGRKASPTVRVLLLLSWWLSLICLLAPVSPSDSGIQARLDQINDVTLRPPPLLQVDDNQRECVRLREATQRLYTQLKEMERRHQEERERLQV